LKPIYVNFTFLGSCLCQPSGSDIILLMLPARVATCERSFSKLKLIKNFLRSTMSQQRLQWSGGSFHRKPSCKAVGYVQYCWHFCTRGGTKKETAVNWKWKICRCRTLQL